MLLQLLFCFLRKYSYQTIVIDTHRENTTNILQEYKQETSSKLKVPHANTVLMEFDTDMRDMINIIKR